MILAAGLGTRLRPLTNDRPKALVTLRDRTLLEIAVERLRAFGIRELIVNVHHHADLVIEYLRKHGDFGLRIEVSREHDLLDTGGGLKKAAHFFLGGDGPDGPFLVHNVDVISNIDFAQMMRFHREQNALATLAVQSRATSRPLLFDASGLLQGRGPGRDADIPGRANQNEHALDARAFCGIHVIAPRLLDLMTEEGAFSIIDVYVRLAAEGEKILAFDADGFAWRDLGRPESLREAEREMARGDYGV